MKRLLFLLLIPLFITPSQGQTYRDWPLDTLNAGTKDTSYTIDLSRSVGTGGTIKAKHVVQLEFWSPSGKQDTLRVQIKDEWRSGWGLDSNWVWLPVYNPYKSSSEDSLIYVTSLSNGQAFTKCVIYLPLVGDKIRVIRENPSLGNHTIIFRIKSVGP